MTRLAAVLTGLLFTAMAVQAQWTWITPLPEGNELFDATFVSGGLAWAVGGNGAIMHTTDDGATWVSQANPLRVTPFICLSVLFTDATSGMVSTNVGTLLRTSDGGDTWTQLPPAETDIQKLRRAPDGSIWGFGSNGSLARTTDMGTTWTVLPTGTSSVVFDVAFPAYALAVAACGGGTLLTSTDHGASWTPSSHGSGDIISIDFPSAAEGYAVRKPDVLMRTRDGGATWSDTTIFINALRSIRFHDTLHGWLVGDSRGTVLHTANGGVTWTQATVDPTLRYTFRTAISRTPENALIVGEGGGLFETLDGGATFGQLGNAMTRSHLYAVSPESDTTAIVFGEQIILGINTRGNSGIMAGSQSLPIHTGIAYPGHLIAGGTQGEVFAYLGPNNWATTVLSTAGQIEQFARGSGQLWLAGNHGTIARSSDDGVTWTLTDPGITDDLHGICAVPGTAGDVWVVGNGGKVLHTTNNGAFWQVQTLPGGANLHAVTFTSALNGWVGGQMVLYQTTNGGANWVPRTIPGMDVVYQLHFTASTPAQGLVVMSRGVARTKDGGATFYRTDYPATGIRCVAPDTANWAWMVGDFGVVQTYSPAPVISLNPDIIDFGDVPTNRFKDVDVTIENTGEVPMRVGNMAALGPGFTVRSFQPDTLAPGETMTATLRFAPADTGAVRGTSTISSNATMGNPNIALQGRGIPPLPSALIHSPALVDFGKVKLGRIKAKEIRIENRSAMNILITEERISGADSMMFQVGRPSAYFLTPAFVDSVQVVFGAQRPGIFTSTLVIVTNDPAVPEYPVPMRGEAINPQATAIPNPLDFGKTVKDSVKTLPLVIKNTGTDDLVIARATLSGTDSADFSFPAPSTATIAVGDSISIPVRFAPTTYGDKRALITLETTDLVNPGTDVPLLGRSTTAAEPASEALAFRLGAMYPLPARARADAPVLLPITLRQPSAVTVQLRDILGRVVSEQRALDLAPGQHALAIPAIGLAPGMYTVSVGVRTAAGRESATRPLLVIE